VASNITTDRINDIDVHAIVEHCHAHADESLPQGVLAAATSKLLDLVASCSTVTVSTLMPILRRFVRQLRWGVNGRGIDVQRSRPPSNELAEGAHLAATGDRGELTLGFQCLRPARALLCELAQGHTLPPRCFAPGGPSHITVQVFVTHWPFRISHSGTIRAYSSPFSVNAVSACPYIDNSVDPKPGVPLVGGGGPPRSIHLSFKLLALSGGHHRPRQRNGALLRRQRSCGVGRQFMDDQRKGLSEVIPHQQRFAIDRDLGAEGSKLRICQSPQWHAGVSLVRSAR